MRTIAFSLLSLAVLVGSLGFNTSQAETYHEHIHFNNGHHHHGHYYHHDHDYDGHAIHRGTVQGFDVMEYTVNAHANEKMVINLKTNNNSNYFNIKAPNAETPFFKGEPYGDQYSVIVPTDGVYTIQVFMLPHAAQENQTARYTLDLKVKTPD